MRVLKIAGIVVGSLGVLMFLGVGMVFGWSVIFGPAKRDLTARQFERTPERIERGRYLVEGLYSCTKCHSPIDAEKPGAPPREGMLGAGDVIIPEGPGRIVASNLTPDPETGIGSWTDDEIARAIREGIGKDGRALFPMMPYENFRNMNDDDLAAIVVYLRSLPPVRNPLPKTEVIFPVKYFIRSGPAPVLAPVAHKFGTLEERGKYLVQQASCANCHTTHDERHVPLPGMDFAGGNVMKEREGTATTANLTPDASGIAGYDVERFRDVMRTGVRSGRSMHPLMPYYQYRHLTDEDLDAMFAYLRTLKPVKHWTSTTAKPSMCAVCNMEHGMGEMNIASAQP